MLCNRLFLLSAKSQGQTWAFQTHSHGTGAIKGQARSHFWALLTINFPQAQKFSGIGHTWEGLLHLGLKIQGKFYSWLGAQRQVRLKSGWDQWNCIGFGTELDLRCLKSFQYHSKSCIGGSQICLCIWITLGVLSKHRCLVPILDLKDLEFPELSRRHLTSEALFLHRFHPSCLLADFTVIFILLPPAWWISPFPLDGSHGRTSMP